MSVRRLSSRTAANSNVLPISGFRDPLSLPGLVAWWDSSATTYLGTGTTGTGGVSNGSGVGYLQDRSGNGWHATQGTANSRPTYSTTGFGGVPALSYNGSSSTITTGTGFPLSGDTPFTIAIASSRASTSHGAQFRCGNSGYTDAILLADGFSAQARCSLSGGNVDRSFTYSATTSGFVTVLTAPGSGVQNYTVHRNGTLATPSTFSSGGVRNLTTSGVTWQFGAVSGVGFHSGMIGHCAVYSRVLSAAERSALTSWLGGVYGITVA
jgi:hypothetical protein